MGDQALQSIPKEIIVTVVKISVMVGVSYVTISWFLKRLDPTGNKGKAAKEKVSTFSY